MLAAIKDARAFITEEQLSADGALTYLVREFGLPEDDPVVRAIVRFATAWTRKRL